MSGDLKETLSFWDAMLFMEEEMSPIFCKPKLLPMKTVTMEKLEQMQRDAERLMRAVDQQPEVDNGVVESGDVTKGEDGTTEKQTEVWSADTD